MTSIVGQGDFRYELVEGWAKLPEGWRIGQTSPATDSEGRVYLFTRSEHPVIVRDRDGRFPRRVRPVLDPDGHRRRTRREHLRERRLRQRPRAQVLERWGAPPLVG